MCLLVVISRPDADVPLQVAANRDERLDRPAVAATVLAESGPRVIGGRDLFAGGTWLAVNEHGVVCGLTNRPSAGGRDPSKRSRGELPLAVTGHPDAASAVADFAERFRSDDYNPAWILVGDRRALYYLQMGGAGAPEVEPLGPGVHVLANGPLHDPSPKTDQVRRLLGPIVGLGPSEAATALRGVLSDHTVPPALEASRGDTERPAELSCPCVHLPDYGTRSAAIVSVGTCGPPHMWVADGPPCRAPFVAVDHLWAAPVPSGASERP